jgi:hypothetical protein
MDIEVLRLRTTDEELTMLARQNTPPDTGVKDLEIRIQAEGIVICGKYTGMLVPISFETLFEPSISEGIVEARLATVKVAGFAANNIRKVLLTMLTDMIEQQPGITVKNDTIRLDLAALLEGYDLPVRVVPKSLYCRPGFLVIDGGI